MEARGEAEERGCKGRQWDPSGPDKTEWKTDECGECGGETEGRRDGAWIYLGGYTVWRALSDPRHLTTAAPASLPASLLLLTIALSLRCCLPGPELEQQFVARGKRRKSEEKATKEGVFASLWPSFTLSFLQTSLIPRWVPSFITAYHVCIILYRTLPINIIRAARST